MWARFRTSNSIKKDGKEITEEHRNLNLNEEYFCVLRTKSYAEFLSKAHFTVNEESSSSSYCHLRFSEILLEPGQEEISAILESANILSRKSDLKDLILKYFDLSAEASKICSRLLKSINQIQSNYRFIKQVLDIINDYSPEKFSLILSELQSFIILNNPFSNLDIRDFKIINGQYSSVLNHLKSKRRKVTKKIKLIKLINKASGVCVTAAFGLVAVTAIVLAAHALAAIILGPVLFSFPMKPLKKRIGRLRFLRCGFLRKVREQLDVAAKGTYIVNREFDTISRLVARLHDEIEHNKAMVQFCLERKEDKFSFQVRKELKKGDDGFRKQVEELEEHLYLCLVTINRARTLVIKEIQTSCVNNV